MIKSFQKKSNQKQGIAALMLVLILGTIALAIAISEFTYSIWTRQNLEWNILKTQGQARAESGMVYSLIQYLYNINTTGLDIPALYLTELDKNQNLGIVSNIITTTDNPPCSQDIQCKKITTTFSPSWFTFDYGVYIIEERPPYSTGEAVRVRPEFTPNYPPQAFRLPILEWPPQG